MSVGIIYRQQTAPAVHQKAWLSPNKTLVLGELYFATVTTD